MAQKNFVKKLKLAAQFLNSNVAPLACQGGEGEHGPQRGRGHRGLRDRLLCSLSASSVGSVREASIFLQRKDDLSSIHG